MSTYKIKPLVWHNKKANTSIGCYQVYKGEGHWHMIIDYDYTEILYKTRKEAMEACEKDYTDTLLQCLEQEIQ